MDKYIFVVVLIALFILVKYDIYLDQYEELETLKEKIDYRTQVVDSLSDIINKLCRRRHLKHSEQQLMYNSSMKLNNDQMFKDSLVTLYNMKISKKFYKNIPWGLKNKPLPERY